MLFLQAFPYDYVCRDFVYEYVQFPDGFLSLSFCCLSCVRCLVNEEELYRIDYQETMIIMSSGQ